MAVKHKRQLTEDERAERRAQDREYARHAVEQLRSSDGWNAWLTARASFRNYSLGNQLQIAMARPTKIRRAGCGSHRNGPAKNGGPSICPASARRCWWNIWRATPTGRSLPDGFTTATRCRRMTCLPNKPSPR